MKARQPVFRACFDAALRTSPRLAGKVVLAWRIESSGEVQGAGVRQSTFTDNCMLQCMLDVARATRFPPADGPCFVAYPFVFENPGAP